MVKDPGEYRGGGGGKVRRTPGFWVSQRDCITMSVTSSSRSTLLPLDRDKVSSHGCNTLLFGPPNVGFLGLNEISA